MTHRLAIYDMDKTITRQPTWTPFLAFAMRGRARWRLALMPAAAIAGLAYVAKLIDRAKLKQTTQWLVMGGSTAATRVDELSAAFADHIVATGVLDAARKRIAADKAEGYRLVMATASYAFYARAIAERLGFDAVIATDHLGQDLDYVRARIAGDNCYDAAKLRMITDWMAGEGIPREAAHIRAYSDHVSDAPMLQFADEPYAANPHKPLAELAGERGWPRVDWG